MSDERSQAGPPPSRWANGPQPYITSPRARITCGREFERITADIATLGERVGPAGSAGWDIRRAPGRCIVQAGALALTVSWVRGKGDTAEDGRLMVMEWEGTVGGQPPSSTAPANAMRAGATLVREEVFLAEAASDDQWRWRSGDVSVDSAELARRSVDALRRRVAGAAP